MVGQDPPSAGSTYHNTTMRSYYKDGESFKALHEPDSKTSVKEERELARVSLMVSHLERCYAEKSNQVEIDTTLALEIFRSLKRTKQRLNKGILKAIIMIYQDMFRVRPYMEKGRIIHCMHRVGGFRFNRSLTQANLREFSATVLSWNGKVDHQSMVLSLAFRAIHFHDFVKRH
jgi:hypothetical protein